MAQIAQARKVVTRSPSRKVGLVNCRWFQDAPVEHESDLEKRFVHSSFLLWDLQTIWSQPFTLDLDGAKYTPDFLLTFDSVRVVVEIKWASKVRKYHRTFNLAAKQLAEKGFLFYVVTQNHVDIGQRSSVASEIIRYGKSELDSERVQSIIDCVPHGTPISLGELQKSAKVARPAILHLVARRHLVLHPDDLIDSETRVYRPSPIAAAKCAGFEARFNVKPWDPETLEFAMERPKREKMRKRAKISNEPYVQLRTQTNGKLAPHPLSGLAGGLPSMLAQSIEGDEMTSAARI